MNKPIVRIEHLSHRYSVQWAIRDINLEISGNGIYGLLGSNGAGKSTLMNIMCGVLKQTKGDVFIDGINTKTDPVAAKRLMGFLPQKPPLLVDLTVSEYLVHCAGLRLIPKREIPAAVEAALEKCGLVHFRDRLIRNLSGGYQQRVGIAQAVIHNPDLVVLDEPTNGLDPNQILEIRKLIMTIAEDCTVVLSTHILSEVQATCSHIIMLDDGHIVFSGSMADFDNYIVPDSIMVTMLAERGAEELLGLPGVISVTATGENRYRVKVTEVTEMLDAILAEARTRDWLLREIYQERNSLDTIFAELTKKTN